MKAKKFYLIRRRGFSLLELFIAMVIIAIFASFITANINSQAQTAQSEAERLEAYLTDLTRKADRRHLDFTIKFESDNAYYYWAFGKDDDVNTRGYLYHENPDKIDTTKYTLLFNKPILAQEFSISHNFENLKENQLTYNATENEFNEKGRITLTQTLDQTKYYVHIRSGRARASENEKDDEETSEEI